MGGVRVYKFTGYNFHTDEIVTSQRWATDEFISIHHYGRLDYTLLEVDQQDMDGDLTKRDFKPKSKVRSGFQSSVDEK